MKHFALIVIALAAIFLIGCEDKKTTTPTANGGTPTFSLAWSEYPSWSVFGVAQEQGIVADVEKKYGIKIVLKLMDYDTCITSYGSNTVDAVCITNMDALSPSLGRQSVAIMPTSTSVGADACIGVGNTTDLASLKGKPTYGLEKSVSQYAFERNLEIKGLKPADFPFRNMDPAAAAQAVQTKQNNVEAIMVWNPFVLQTLRTRTDSKVIFDSSSIPEEIIDMVVVGKDVLAKPSGEKFATAVAEIYYRFNEKLAAAKDDSMYVALGAKFSNLNGPDMKTCCTQTRFYSTPAKGIALYEGTAFRKTTMPMIVDFCVKHGICAKAPLVGFEEDGQNIQLNFTTKYIKAVQ